MQNVPSTCRLAYTSTLSPLSTRTQECGGHARGLPDLLQELREAWPTVRLCLRGAERKQCQGHDQRLCPTPHSQVPNIYSVAVLWGLGDKRDVELHPRSSQSKQLIPQPCEFCLGLQFPHFYPETGQVVREQRDLVGRQDASALCPGVEITVPQKPSRGRPHCLCSGIT